jgi:hypothetical protein
MNERQIMTPTWPVEGETPVALRAPSVSPSTGNPNLGVELNRQMKGKSLGLAGGTCSVGKQNDALGLGPPRLPLPLIKSGQSICSKSGHFYLLPTD